MIGSASTALTTAAGSEQERDLADAVRDGVGEPAHVAPRREPRERREEDGRDRDREHPLRQHVDEERLLDRGRREQRVDEPRGEERVDHGVDVDEAEAEGDRHHQLQHLEDSRVAPVEHDAEPLFSTLEARAATAPAGSTWITVATRIDPA